MLQGFSSNVISTPKCAAILDVVIVGRWHQIKIFFHCYNFVLYLKWKKQNSIIINSWRIVCVLSFHQQNVWWNKTSCDGTRQDRRKCYGKFPFISAYIMSCVINWLIHASLFKSKSQSETCVVCEISWLPITPKRLHLVICTITNVSRINFIGICWQCSENGLWNFKFAFLVAALLGDKYNGFEFWLWHPIIFGEKGII